MKQANKEQILEFLSNVELPISKSDIVFGLDGICWPNNSGFELTPQIRKLANMVTSGEGWEVNTGFAPEYRWIDIVTFDGNGFCSEDSSDWIWGLELLNPIALYRENKEHGQAISKMETVECTKDKSEEKRVVELSEVEYENYQRGEPVTIQREATYTIDWDKTGLQERKWLDELFDLGILKEVEK